MNDPCIIIKITIIFLDLYTRWIDNGNLQGFVSAKGKGENISDKEHIKWQVMTWSDLENA